MTFLDMLGKPCPIPVIEAKKALRATAPGETITLAVDNEAATQNLEKMAAGLGHSFACERRNDGNYTVSLTAGEGRATVETPDGGLVVAIGHTSMGGPSEELGTTLMKSFIYSLTELDTPPEHLLFFNGGVHLTTEGSTALGDLETLAHRGTQISSCGACLNYFGLSDKVAIGQITNMYAIASTMSQAKRLINL